MLSFCLIARVIFVILHYEVELIMTRLLMRCQCSSLLCCSIKFFLKFETSYTFNRSCFPDVINIAMILCQFTRILSYAFSQWDIIKLGVCEYWCYNMMAHIIKGFSVLGNLYLLDWSLDNKPTHNVLLLGSPSIDLSLGNPGCTFLISLQLHTEEM